MKQKIIYLNSGKCAWGKCIFCGWGKLDYKKKSIHELKDIIDETFRKEKFDVLKVFNSGSFLDINQIPRAFRSYLVRKCEQNGVKQLVIESRGEFFNDEFVSDMKSDKVKVSIGIGLECGDDTVLKKLNKGMTVADYEKHATFLKEHNFGVRSYVLVNAPYSNQKTLDKTIELALKYSDSIAMMNWFPHGRSEAFQLWIEGKWKPFDEKQFNDATKNYTDPKIEKYFEEFMFTPRFPEEIPIVGATVETLTHPYFEVWQDFISRFYKTPAGKNIALFIPCAFKKPYRFSKLHKAINEVLSKVKNFESIHEIVISNPGVIPYELSDRYPFTRYDWPEWDETPEVKKKYIEVTQQRIENYLKGHKYEKYYCYLKYDSESYVALKNACKKLKIELVNVLSEEVYEKIKTEKNPLSLPEATENLKLVD